MFCYPSTKKLFYALTFQKFLLVTNLNIDLFFNLEIKTRQHYVDKKGLFRSVVSESPAVLQLLPREDESLLLGCIPRNKAFLSRKV